MSLNRLHTAKRKNNRISATKDCLQRVTDTFIIFINCTCMSILNYIDKFDNYRVIVYHIFCHILGFTKRVCVSTLCSKEQ